MLRARKRRKTKLTNIVITNDRDDLTCKVDPVGMAPSCHVTKLMDRAGKLHATNVLGTQYGIYIPVSAERQPQSRRASHRSHTWSKAGEISVPVCAEGY